MQQSPSVSFGHFAFRANTCTSNNLNGDDNHYLWNFLQNTTTTCDSRKPPQEDWKQQPRRLEHLACDRTHNFRILLIHKIHKLWEAKFSCVSKHVISKIILDFILFLKTFELPNPMNTNVDSVTKC